MNALTLDLSSLESVRLFVDNFLNISLTLDLLVLNAGIFGKAYQLTVDNLEQTFQINYLSHFYLAHLLRPIMVKNRDKARPLPKIVAVAAESHRFATCDMAEDITPSYLSTTNPKTFVPVHAYNNSKLWCLMFAMEADHRWKDICCIAVHPGNMISTNLSRHWWVYRLLFAIVRPFTKSLQQAAGTIVFAAAASDLSGTSGLYVNNCFLCKPAKVVENLEIRTRLWNVSMDMLMNRLKEIEKDPDLSCLSSC